MCERRLNLAMMSLWQVAQTSLIEGLASTPSGDNRAIGLWQSLQDRPRASCTEPSQCWRAPPAWQPRQTVVWVCTSVFASWVNAMIEPGCVGFFAWSEPGPWQLSQAACGPLLAAPALNDCTCSEWAACMSSSEWQAM